MPNTTRVLAVDDRAENLVALAAVLDALPVEVVTATSGHDALRELLNDDFALILLDVVMPGMDGFECAQHIKSRPRTRDIPIIFLTAAGEAGAEAFRGYAAGAVDYLTKPFDPWLLRAKVSVFVELHHRNLRLREQATMLRRSLAEHSGVGCEPLRRLRQHVTAVEDDVERLQVEGEGTSEAFAQLVKHVDELRLAVDALGD
ncbi:response regulator [Actinomadura kijaniata]|uniref:CheY-like chemotaxis protein n=1 Tax=Actinomadura namibiensis TaxID=182080 RepID=A0A7W3LNQ6_ACTNM|nr:response regulator [Actinomadura namibiensis]MBA8951452.1 CheY-like chemotaxis protein [Actinomadura namibiensis]